MAEVDSSVNSSVPRNAGDILERALRRVRSGRSSNSTTSSAC
jgi:hypothetical protein